MELRESGDRISYLLDEGAFTYVADQLTRLGEIEGGSFAARLRKGDIVKISANYDRAVGAITATTDRIHGIIIGKPKGNLPIANASAGDYEPRVAAVTPFVKGKTYVLPIADANSAISPGDRLIYDISSAAMDKAASGSETTAAQVIAEEAADVNTGGVIECTVIGEITIRS